MNLVDRVRVFGEEHGIKIGAFLFLLNFGVITYNSFSEKPINPYVTRIVVLAGACGFVYSFVRYRYKNKSLIS